MRDNSWIKLGLLALATFVVATLGAMAGAPIASALGVGSLTPLVAAVSSLLAIFGVLVMIDVIHTALSARWQRPRRGAVRVRSRPARARSSA